MATAGKQIRVSQRVKNRLDNRQRGSESYNDALDRLLGDIAESDFDDGFGIRSETHGEWIREKHPDAKGSTGRPHSLADRREASTRIVSSTSKSIDRRQEDGRLALPDSLFFGLVVDQRDL